MSINKFEIAKNYLVDFIQTDIETLVSKLIISKRFNNVLLNRDEKEILQKIKSVIELHIIENLTKIQNNEIKALASVYFDIASSIFSFEKNNNDSSQFKNYDILKLISIAYIGEEWHKLKRFLLENQFEFEEGKQWNDKIFNALTKTIVQLVSAKNWEQLNKVIDYINELREMQKEFEEEYLNSLKNDERPFAAGELFALYNFARSIEILATYSLLGQPNDARNKIDNHLSYAQQYAFKSGNKIFELLLIFFDAFAKKYIENTLWHVTNSVNNFISEFNKLLTTNSHNGIYQLLYPQKETIIHGGFFDLTKKAILINLPTSSGKTLIAQYRILVALNQFRQSGGWVAYIVPTRALINQVYKELNHFFSKINLKVAKLSGALELDAFETDLLEKDTQQPQFDVLVTTYEKLNLIIRQGLGKKPERPLVLTVVDEAHNIADEERGITLEMLLTIIKNDIPEANFLLLSPEIPNSDEIVRWLAEDRGKTISLSLHWWQPNERIIGAIIPQGKGKNYKYIFKTLNTIKSSLKIGEDIEIVPSNDHTQNISAVSKRDITKEVLYHVVTTDNPIVVLVDSPSETFRLAEEVYNSLPNIKKDNEIDLLIRFIKAELGKQHPMVNYLSKGVAIHSSAIPDEIRILIEEHVRMEKIKILIATTTIAQGINFPISSIIINSYYYRTKGRTFTMPARDFWNAAGRVGRLGQTKPGWIGIICQNDDDVYKTSQFVLKNIEYLHSQILTLIDNTLSLLNNHNITANQVDFAKLLQSDPRWSSLLQYISHLYNEMNGLQELIAHLDEKLNASLGFRQLDTQKKSFFKESLSNYLSTLNSNYAKLADNTGFSTLTINQFIGKLSGLKLSRSDWEKHQLFSEQNQALQKLIGIMFDTYEIKKSMEELRFGESFDKRNISRLISKWVNGQNISELAQQFFSSEDFAKSVEKTTKAIHKIITNAVVWALAAIQKMPNSGIDFDKMNEDEKKKFLNIPSYIYYGVNTDEAVLMRRHNVPRSIAQQLGQKFLEQHKSLEEHLVQSWLMDDNNWKDIQNQFLNGLEFKKLWQKINL